MRVGSAVRLHPDALASWSRWGFESDTVGLVVSITWRRGWPGWLVVDWGYPLGLVSHVGLGQLIEVEAAAGSLWPGGVESSPRQWADPLGQTEPRPLGGP